MRCVVRVSDSDRRERMEREAVLDNNSSKMHLGCGHWANKHEWQAMFAKVTPPCRRTRENLRSHFSLSRTGLFRSAAAVCRAQVLSVQRSRDGDGL